jgi:hypothetical protein
MNNFHGRISREIFDKPIIYYVTSYRQNQGRGFIKPVFYLYFQNFLATGHRRFKVRMKLALVAGFIVLLAAASGFGQQTLVASINAKIDFSFKVEGKVLPAGVYDFSREKLSDVFKIMGPDKKVLLVPFMTRLSKDIHTSAEDSHIVFDKVGDTYLLSEIWIPGDDGYLFLATKGLHTHKTLNIKR